MPIPGEWPTLSRDADRDLDSILDESLLEWGPIQAARYRQRLDDAMQLIVAFPDIGVRDDRLPSGFWVRFVGTHLICYRLVESEVVVYRILHQRQSPTGLFDDAD